MLNGSLGMCITQLVLPSSVHQCSICCLCHVIRCYLVTLQKMAALLWSMKTGDASRLVLQWLNQHYHDEIDGPRQRPQCSLKYYTERGGSVACQMKQSYLLHQRLVGIRLHRGRVMRTLSYPSSSHTPCQAGQFPP